MKKNIVNVKLIVLFVLAAIAVTVALLHILPDRRIWVARFSYCIAPENGGVPFLVGNREWAERFCAPSFSRDVVAQCLSRAVVKVDEDALMGVVTGATIQVSREKDGVVCVFSAAADSRRIAEEVARCYLIEMNRAIDEGNRLLVKKATSEIVAQLKRHEALAKVEQEKYDEAQNAGAKSAEELRVAAEKLASRCAALRQEISEAELAASRRNDCLKLIRPLSVEVMANGKEQERK